MFKRNKIKLSVLIIAIVVFGVIFSTLASTLFFGIFYKNSMFDSAYVFPFFIAENRYWTYRRLTRPFLIMFRQ